MLASLVEVVVQVKKRKGGKVEVVINGSIRGCGKDTEKRRSSGNGICNYKRKGIVSNTAK